MRYFMKSNHKSSRKGLLFATLALGILLIFACKQNQSGNEGDKTKETVTIAITHDSYIKEVASNLKVNKSESLGFSALKDRLNPKFRDGYELKNIHLGNNKDGKIISDSSPYTFNENASIYLVSKKADVAEELKLFELKVDASPVQISDVIDLGKTLKEKIAIEANATPSDAEVLFEPELESGMWNLGKEKGKRSLKITVKKGTETKEYTVNIEKLEAGTPIITKITVADKTRTGNNVTSDMVFIASHEATEVQINIETEPANASKFFNSNKSENGNFTLNLSGNETSVTISVGDAPKNSEYTVKVRKPVLPSSLIETLMVIPTGTIKGQFLSVDFTQMQKVLAGDRSITATMDGYEAMMNVMSTTKHWTSCRVNGQTVEVTHSADIASQVLFPVTIDKKGKEKEMAVEVEAAGELAFILFRLKRSDKTIDLPITNLFINDEGQVSDLTTLPKLYNEGKVDEPEFLASEGAILEVRCGFDQIKIATIDGAPSLVEKKQDNENNDFWACSNAITGIKPQGKNVAITVEPLDPETYHPTKWTFRLAYKAPAPIEVEYEFNGMNEYGVPEDFAEGLENNTEPTLEVKGTYLNIKIIGKAEVKEIKLNDLEYKENEITDIGNGSFGIKGRMELDGTNATPITITVIPKDEDAYSPKVLKFKAKGNGVAEKITPTLISISKDKNLPQATFLDKIADGTTNPLHEVHGTSADILAYINTYEYDFLCKEVKVDGNKVNIEPSAFPNQWQITPSIPVTADTPSNVVIEFVGYDGISIGTTWKFQVKGGGALPGIPKEDVNLLTINGKGTDKNPLPEDFTEHLIDGQNPEHVFDGKKAEITVGTGKENLIKKVTFKVDSSAGVDVDIQKEGQFIHFARHTFENIADGNSHLVELLVHPVETEKYSPLKLTFKLKWSGKKSPLPLIVGVNGTKRENGWKGTIAGERTILLVQARQNVMKEVKIGLKGHEQNSNIINYPGKNGRTVWHAEREVNLLVNDEVVEQTFVIQVTPLDENEYESATYEYKLTGMKVAQNNAEFVWLGNDSPSITHNLEWVNNAVAVQYSDMYGVKADTITIKTVSSRASVKYQIVNSLTNKPVEGQNEGEMTNDPNNKGTHSARIVMLPNQPTHLRLWVVAEDGITKNEQKGRIAITFNSSQLAWSYENETDAKDFKKNAYDVIEIAEDQALASNKKIYLAFSVYNEQNGYSVSNDGLPNHQTAFEKLGALTKDFDSYKTSVDVSSLLDKSKNELEAVLKVKKNNILCFTYNVKIKLKK